MTKKAIKVSAKKPKTQNIPIKKLEPETKKAIDFFNDDLPATDWLHDKKSKKLELSPAAGRTSMNDRFFNWFEGKGEYFALALTVAALTAVAYWLIKQ